LKGTPDIRAPFHRLQQNSLLLQLESKALSPTLRQTDHIITMKRTAKGHILED